MSSNSGYFDSGGFVLPGLSGSSSNFFADPVGAIFRKLNPAYQPSIGSTTLANLSRQQWTDATSSAYPLQDQLINYAEDQTQIPKARAQAVTDVDNAYAGQTADTQRTLQGLGITPDATQAAGIAKQTALSKGLSEAGTSNAAAQQTYQNQQGLLS